MCRHRDARDHIPGTPIVTSPSRRQEALSTSQGSGVTIYQRLGDLSGDVIILAEGWAAGRDGVKTFSNSAWKLVGNATAQPRPVQHILARPSPAQSSPGSLDQSCWCEIQRFVLRSFLGI